MLARFSVVAAFVAMSTAASAATFSVLSPAATVAPQIAGSVGGVGFVATGFTVDDRLSALAAAQVGWDGVGFGVAGLGGAASTGTPSSPTQAGDFTIDGLGVDRNELLRLTFARPVFINALSFNFIDRLDDVTLRVDGGAPMRFGFGGDTSQNAGGVSSLIVLGLLGTQLDIIAGFPNPNCTTSSKQPCGGANDLFQLVAADVAAVPLPAAGWLLLAGLGGLTALARRRRAL